MTLDMQLCKVWGGLHALLGLSHCVAVIFDKETEMGMFSLSNGFFSCFEDST
jgi:hypothetical protein